MENESFKIRLNFELAYEIIFISSIVILIGIAFLFATNLLSFNWFTVVFIVIALYVSYLKFNSFLIIDQELLKITYFKYFTKNIMTMAEINEITFYEKKRGIKIKGNNQVMQHIYLSKKNKRALLDYLVNHYPRIACYYLNKDEKTAN